MRQRALVVDPRDHVARLVRGAGFDVVAVASGEAALFEYGQRWYDLVLVSLVLPGLRGPEVCRELRRRSATPILVISSGDDTTALAALDAGADDHLRLPVDPAELRARVRAVARRRCGPLAAPHVVRVGRVEVRVAGDQVTVGSRVVAGPAATVVAALLARPGVVTTPEALRDAVVSRHGAAAAAALPDHLAALDALLVAAGARRVERVDGGGFRLGSPPDRGLGDTPLVPLRSSPARLAAP